MADILQKIEAYKRNEISAAKAAVSLDDLKAAYSGCECASWVSRKPLKPNMLLDDYALIAEIKKGEPVQRAYSRGFQSAAACKSL
jgi:indole-3-glycerol phosphate synthase